MVRQIPLYFDSVIVSSPIEKISDQIPNVGRVKVRVFTKYGNRNGSYITEPVAQQLIESATSGMCPVVGFYDPETNTWASHSGPTLAHAYGYVEDFLGWEPFQDTDGKTRDYAVFSVILFTDYFEEASKILGQNQSMELNPSSIDGAWTEIEGIEYFVYTKAKMLGFCVIGEHEPCFSVSSFFAKNDDIQEFTESKLASMLFELKQQVEALKNGGEQPMNELENQEVVEQVDNPQEIVEPAQIEFAADEITLEAETNVEEEETVEVEKQVEETVNTEFALLQTSFNELQQNYNAAQNRIAEFEATTNALNQQNENLNAQIQNLENTITNLQATVAQFELERKTNLLHKYEKLVSEEEINSVQAEINNISYDELESKLAINFANSKMVDSEYVPLPNPTESPFSLLMKKHRKN